MQPGDLVFLSAGELAPLLRTGEISPVELVRAHLERIEAVDPALNSFITVTADLALDQARQAEAEIGAGRYRGALHGIPYAPKDILATRGIRTTNGSRVTEDWVPDFESTITRRLSEAGAILMGKLNLLEFAMGSGTLSGFGPSRNPWSLEHSPAGSSSGSGAALAAHLVPLSIGTDTGGSIRGPAAANGVVGLKQTYGRVSRYGVTTLSWSLDHAGPMARTVEDCALLLQAIAGPDPLDPTAEDAPVPDYVAGLAQGVRGVRIGVPTDDIFNEGTPEVSAAMAEALRVLEELGARIVPVSVPHALYSGSAGWIVAMAEAASFHEKRLRETPELFDPLVRERLEAALFYPATDYIKSMRIRTVLLQEMRAVFEQCDVMAVPGANAPAGLLPSPDVAGSDVRPGSSAGRYRGGTTFLGNMTGLPALALPCGFAEGPPRLPLSLQLYGRPFDEAMLFRVGHAYERATPWHRERAPIGAAASGSA